MLFMLYIEILYLSLIKLSQRRASIRMMNTVSALTWVLHEPLCTALLNLARISVENPPPPYHCTCTYQTYSAPVTVYYNAFPGLTSAAIPHLVKSGVSGVSVGVNNMTPPPAVPNPFVWKYGDADVVGTWHKGIILTLIKLIKIIVFCMNTLWGH